MRKEDTMQAEHTECDIIIITQEKWDSICSDYKGTWQDYYNERPDWIGRKVVMSGCINPNELGKLLVEGEHFIIRGEDEGR